MASSNRFTLLFLIATLLHYHVVADNSFSLEYKPIQHYLNPKLFNDPEVLNELSRRLRQDHVVVINDAFIPEFAEAMHHDLDSTDAWRLHEGKAEDGFHYSHHNIYDIGDFSELMSATRAMFEHPESKRFMSELSDRDCYGDTDASAGSPSYYMPGDHSLPHTDHVHQRTVAYVWHLSKNWLPEWGGALYWAPEHDERNAFLHASFNTLVLFSVTSTSHHFVTSVSPHATEKRLTFNGWWQSEWEPSVDDDLEELLATPEQRHDVTDFQFSAIENIVHGEEFNLDPERRERLQVLVEDLQEELYPTEPVTTFVVEF